MSLIRVVAGIGLLLSAPGHALCSPEFRSLIEHEAREMGVMPAYAVAVAETISACDPEWRGRAGRVGLMGVATWQLPPEWADREQWLPYPAVNAHVGVRRLADLLDSHGDWERTLSEYFSGDPVPDPATRARIYRVFQKVRSGVKSPRCRSGHAIDLDDFGPRLDCGSTIRNADYRRPGHGGCGAVRW